ncbi:hypothetical protein CANMA_002703 [Candida margitis]|uniref:uncharacterized protein n=1 Tax=Candida margitis TaxID=1775924 RepID=UPI00222636FC|nr:uncharacterized protein CANMA_002703 [Candida margitis]KAI5967935.1 hypothetical protein CANMA_002703 [Candida margitis]
MTDQQVTIKSDTKKKTPTTKIFKQKVYRSSVPLNKFKPWIEQTINKLLDNIDDEVLHEYIYELLDTPLEDDSIDIINLQQQLPAFLEPLETSTTFCIQLWDLMLRVQRGEKPEELYPVAETTSSAQRKPQHLIPRPSNTDSAVNQKKRTNYNRTSSSTDEYGGHDDGKLKNRGNHNTFRMRDYRDREHSKYREQDSCRYDSYIPSR